MPESMNWLQTTKLGEMVCEWTLYGTDDTKPGQYSFVMLNLDISFYNHNTKLD